MLDIPPHFDVFGTHQRQSADAAHGQHTASNSGGIGNNLPEGTICSHITHTHLIERDVGDGNGKRVRMKTTSSVLAKINFDKKYKKILCDSRIIRIYRIDGEDYVEIVHDVLCSIIVNKELERLTEGNVFISYTIYCFPFFLPTKSVITTISLFKTPHIIST